MELVQARIVTGGVQRLAAFYARLVQAEVVAGLGVDWLILPTTQPWGNRSMIFRDPAGNLINVFSPGQATSG